MQIIHCGQIILPTRTLADGVIIVEGNQIAGVGEQAQLDALLHTSNRESLTDVEHIDARAFFVAPGFIDLHTHGGGGAHPIDGEPDAVARMAAFYARHGVTAFLASAWGAHRQIERAIDAIVRSMQQNADSGRRTPGAEVVGIFLEGPFLSPARPGAFRPETIVAPDPRLLAHYMDLARGHLRLLTLAPELPGAETLINLAHNHGIVCAAGHTDATWEQMQHAATLGVRHVTHMYNAMSPFHHRTPNAIGAALEDERFTVEIIADGIHAHPAAVRLLTRIKGAGQVALITDSIAAAGLPDGAYPLADGPITVANGSARLADGTLAGSVLTMDRGVANLLNFAAATLNDAVQMASTTPARLLGLGQRKGDIAPGYDADLVALDHQLRVQWTMVGGRLVYSQP